MNAFERNIALRVLGIHGAIILGLLLVTGLKGCFRQKPKPEIVTFIEFGAPAPQVNVQQVNEMSEPEPEPPASKVESAPPPPEPVKTIPKQPKKIIKPPKKLDKPKPVLKKEIKPQKPKWKPTKAADINPNKSKRIVAKPVKPTVTDKDISKALSGISSEKVTRSAEPAGNPDAIAAYDSHIYKIYYNTWVQPGSSTARPTEVTLSITSTGRIKSARISRSSGDSQFDATVQAAVNAVKMLPRKPPSGYPLDNIIVQFRIIN